VDDNDTELPTQYTTQLDSPITITLLWPRSLKMTINKVFITGVAGMLGSAVYPYFHSRFPQVLATDKRATESWVQFLDVTNHSDVNVAIQRFQPDLILHLAAETNLEFCELHPYQAAQTNAEATRNIAGIANDCGATLVYISTAGVFDGTKDGFYDERDKPNPIMVYGQTKYDGELFVQELCKKYYIIRAGWMVGGGQKDHKFVSKILEQIMNNESTIHAVNDRWGTPTYTLDFAVNLFRLLDLEAYGLYHMVCEGSGTRFDVAKEIVRICGRHDIDLRGVDSDFFSETYFAPRPRSEMMTNENLRALSINFMRPWKTALEDYIIREFPMAMSTYPAVQTV